MLGASKTFSHRLPAPSAVSRRPYLFIDAQHGLGNRMRAIASASCIADATNRQLVVIWRPDHHCQAEMLELFDFSGPVISDCAAELMRRQSSKIYNYMEIEAGAQFEEPILPDPSELQFGHVYVRSAYSLVSPYSSWQVEDRFLKTLRPSAAVHDLVHQVEHPSSVSAHIRMATGNGFDHLSWESPKNWPKNRHDELIEWRAKSHVSKFTARLDTLITEGACDSLFVACDLPETYALLQDRYGNRLRFLSRTLFDRSAEQAQYALADMILLSRTNLFLASSWSSFSDVARRLAHQGCRFEQSGTEF